MDDAATSSARWEDMEGAYHAGLVQDDEAEAVGVVPAKRGYNVDQALEVPRSPPRVVAKRSADLNHIRGRSCCPVVTRQR